MPPRPASIKVRALQWLAQREHSRNELRDKLLRLLTQGARRTALGIQPASLALTDADAAPDHAAVADPTPATDPAAEVEALLQWLETRGYLSQQRFIASRVHVRESRYGNLRIQQELKQHGLSLDADTRQDLQQTELQRAQEVWRKKYGAADTAKATDAAGRVRQMRFLAGRGFSLDVVRRVVQVGGSSGDTDDDMHDDIHHADPFHD
jgi:regulatory protein